MIDPPSIAHSTEQQTAIVHLTIPRDQIQAAMGPAITEVMDAVTAQGIAPAGPFFSHHFTMSPDTFDFEVGIPVASPVTPTGRVQPSKLPAAKVIRTVYHGPYEGLGDAWGAFDKEIQGQGHTVAKNLWEFYVVGPESGPDPTKWQTQLNRPLVG